MSQSISQGKDIALLIKELINVMLKINEKWETADAETHQLLNNKYPFDRDFYEVVADTINWHESITTANKKVRIKLWGRFGAYISVDKDTFLNYPKTAIMISLRDEGIELDGEIYFPDEDGDDIDVEFNEGITLKVSEKKA